MKILYITTIGWTMGFFKDLIIELVNAGNVVDIATNEQNGSYLVPQAFRDIGCQIFPISCSRQPLSSGNIKAVRQIKRIVNDGKYDLVHCHTPNASVCTRLACRRLRNRGVKVIYTSHGFHFYHGAPITNWVLYYPIEKFLSRYTDMILTINREDYDIAIKKFKSRSVRQIPGVGVATKRFSGCKVDIAAKRKELHLPSDAFVLVSVGELNQNKNHSVVIQALGQYSNSNVYYLIAGVGVLEEDLRRLAESLGVGSNVRLLGFRDDIPEILKAADVFVFPSIREGQGIAAIEAMAAGLPLISSDNRGMRDILVDHENAIICKPNDVNGFTEAINTLLRDKKLMKKMGEINKQKAKYYDMTVTNSIMRDLYNEIINDNT